MVEIYFATKNPEKIQICDIALEGTKIEIVVRDPKLPEIQDDNVARIAIFSAKCASEILKANTIKIDSGLFIEALGGFPGPYSAYVENRLTSTQILNLLESEPNRKAFYQEALAYCPYGGNPVVFEAYTFGNISLKKEGNFGNVYDKIFMVKGDTKTMAHYPDQERVAKYSQDHWRQLVTYLQNSLYL